MKLTLFVIAALLVLLFYISRAWGDVFKDHGWDSIGKDKD